MSDGFRVLAVSQSVHQLLQWVDIQVVRLPHRLLQFPHKVVATRKAKGETGDRLPHLPSCLLALPRLNTRDTAAERDLSRPLVTQCYYQEWAAINEENLSNCPKPPCHPQHFIAP